MRVYGGGVVGRGSPMEYEGSMTAGDCDSSEQDEQGACCV